MMRQRASVGALLTALLAVACAANPNSDLTAFGQNSAANSFEVFDRGVDPPRALVLPVVHDRQTSGPSCGAHALASVVNYWSGAGTVSGEELYSASPPATPSGYSMGELMTLAQDHGLLASAVRLSDTDIIAELEAGRPVLTPVRLPSVYVQQRTLPGGDAPVIGAAKSFIAYRVGRVSEWTDIAMVDHYLLLAGYDEDRFVVVEPVMGYRTISAQKLARYREPFGDAAIVFSGTPPAG